MDSATFRRHGYELVDWIARYLEHPDRYPVLARVKPGEITNALPAQAPEDPETFEAIMADFERLLVPGLTHWNHPGFFAYFATTATAPGVLAEFLSAALNQQAMLWRTSPAATELEAVTLGWLRHLIHLPDSFEGVIYDTASIASLHALAAARHAAITDVRNRGLAGRTDLSNVRVYCSDQAHSSIDKAAITIGFGLDSLRKIPVDVDFKLCVDALSAAITEDLQNGVRPIAVVATIGTTSTTSVDPVASIADVCERERLWLHVDAAYAGAAAMVPSHHHLFHGIERADSVVVNPHKWLFTPFDLSAFYCRRMDVVRAAFSVTPEYLKTPEGNDVRNLMDTGVQLGRRFRALKLWMVLRSLGAKAVRERLSTHMRLAQDFATWIDEHPDFERMAPVPFSVVCFAGGLLIAICPRQVGYGERAPIDAVNASGEIVLSSSTVVSCSYAIGHRNNRAASDAPTTAHIT
jgi:aromatic-L-amino-acid decarboxylase